MEYRDLRDFVNQLEAEGDLKRIDRRVDPNLEATEISDRVLRAGGPALLFERPGDCDIPLLTNLFGTERRVAIALGEENAEALRNFGAEQAAEADATKATYDALKADLLEKETSLQGLVVSLNEQVTAYNSKCVRN